LEAMPSADLFSDFSNPLNGNFVGPRLLFVCLLSAARPSFLTVLGVAAAPCCGCE